MNRFILIFFYLILSCNIPKESIKKTNSSIIYMERTACYGTCPIYKIEIFSDGNAIYTGKRFVKNLGITKFQIPNNDLNQILSMADKIKFQEMKEKYYEPISDLPTTYIRIYNKNIQDYSGSPKKLKQLENLIDNICKKAMNN